MSTSITQRSGTLLSASPPMIRPSEIDGRGNRSDDSLRERQRLDRAEDVDRLQHGVVALPRRRAVRRLAADLDPQRQHALGLDADVQVGRLPGDREIARVALFDQVVGAPLGRRVGLLVGRRRRSARARGSARPARPPRTSSRPGRPSCRRRRARTGGRRRCAGRTAPGVPGTTSTWPWKITVGPVGRADGGSQHRHAVVDAVLDVDVARLEPALDEAGGRLDALHGGGVVGDQPLAECTFLHPREDRPASLAPPQLSMGFEANGTNAGLAARARARAGPVRHGQGRRNGGCAARRERCRARVRRRLRAHPGRRRLRLARVAAVAVPDPLRAGPGAPGRRRARGRARGWPRATPIRAPACGAGSSGCWWSRVVVTVVSIFARDGLAAIIAVEDYPGPPPPRPSAPASG